MVYRHIGVHFESWLPLIVLYPLSIRRNFVVCPHEPLLNLGVLWVKESLQNTGADSW
jgi:hypothetical protein